jgi:hypothetical protein
MIRIPSAAKAASVSSAFKARLKPCPLGAAEAHLVDSIGNPLKIGSLCDFRAVRILRGFRPIQPCRAVLHDNGKSV